MAATPHELRELAVQALFAMDAQNDTSPAHVEQVTRGANVEEGVVHDVTKMATLAWESRKTADEWATRLAPNWPTHRQPAMDRAILRFAIWEMTTKDTPPKVVIDEAIELAKQFSTANSPGFINGVLDAVLKEVNALKGNAE